MLNINCLIYRRSFPVRSWGRPCFLLVQSVYLESPFYAKQNHHAHLCNFQEHMKQNRVQYGYQKKNIKRRPSTCMPLPLWYVSLRDGRRRYFSKFPTYWAFMKLGISHEMNVQELQNTHISPAWQDIFKIETVKMCQKITFCTKSRKRREKQWGSELTMELAKPLRTFWVIT